MLAGLEIIVAWNNRAPREIRESSEDANIKHIEAELKQLNMPPDIVKTAICQHFRPPIGDYPPCIREVSLIAFLGRLKADQQKVEPYDYESYVQVPARRYHLSKVYARLRADYMRGARTVQEIDASQSQAEQMIAESKSNPQIFAQIIVDYSAIICSACD